MKYDITAYSGGNGNGEAVCVIDAENPQQALMTCDGIDCAKEWPYSDGEDGGGWLCSPADQDAAVVADPMQ